MDYWTLIRRLWIEVRTVISLRSFQVTHVDTQLVSSQTKTTNLTQVGNTLLESDSHHYTSFCAAVHTKTLL